jgi:hydrogenase maturation protein HypF
MAKSLDAIRSFAEVKLQEAKHLISYPHPIVLLNKRNEYSFSDLIAPGLHNIGVMLPYSGLHYMLFGEVVDLAFVMTSANPNNQPIIKTDKGALRRLNKTADYFLFNNRRIAHRCDDSVVRLHCKDLVFIRRSRGYSPAPIRLKEKTEYCVLSLGGEKNNTACILLGDKAFVSQHIGDVENVETRSFLEETIKHLIHLTNSKVDIVVSDLHPKFTTTSLAQYLSDQNTWKFVQVQHHYAHVAALMAEYGVNEIVSICCDGYGYGEDGEAWGGEIIFSTLSPLMFKRLAHLEKQPLIGGDLATKYPLRIAAGILNKGVNIKKWLMQKKSLFPYGEIEIQIIYNQLMKKNHLIDTTSCGRILDAVAAVLGICYERTYEGEPAMKLESRAMKGKDVLKLEPIIDDNILNTTQLLLNLFENKNKTSKKDLAHSAHSYLAKGLANIAIINARENNVKTIGFTGGVACNELFTSIIRKTVETHGFKFLVHRIIPPGDGGLSLGQAIVASKSLNHN